MVVPNIARGHLYPTARRHACPIYSRCLVTNKCQNYDKHQLICNVCESRVRPAVNLGGSPAEREFGDDVQVALKIVRDAVNAAFAHPDQEGQNTRDIEHQMRLQQAQQTLANFSKAMGHEIVEEDVYAQTTKQEAQQIKRRFKL
jgi:hypothetical protein